VSEGAAGTVDAETWSWNRAVIGKDYSSFEIM
jgi:hypothetical protein